MGEKAQPYLIKTFPKANKERLVQLICDTVNTVNRERNEQEDPEEDLTDDAGTKTEETTENSHNGNDELEKDVRNRHRVMQENERSMAINWANAGNILGRGYKRERAIEHSFMALPDKLNKNPTENTNKHRKIDDLETARGNTKRNPKKGYYPSRNSHYRITRTSRIPEHERSKPSSGKPTEDIPTHEGIG